MTTKKNKDTRAELREIAAKHGWQLVDKQPGDVGGRGLNSAYVFVRDGRKIWFTRSGGYGRCLVSFNRFGARYVNGEHFTKACPGLCSREQYAESILSAYTDEQFVKVLRGIYEKNYEATRDLFNQSRSDLAAFMEKATAWATESGGSASSMEEMTRSGEEEDG